MFPLYVTDTERQTVFNRNQLEAWLRDPPVCCRWAPDEGRGMPNLQLSRIRDRSTDRLPPDARPVPAGRHSTPLRHEVVMAIIEAPDQGGPLALPSGEHGAEAARLGVFARPGQSKGWRSWITSVDHKRIGIMYGTAALFFFLIGGIEALLIRAAARAAQTARCSRADAVQPGVHDARHHDGLPRRHADGRGVRQLPHAVADRRPRRRLPAAQRVQLLGLPLRRPLPQLVVAPRRRRPTAAGSAYAPNTGVDLLAEPRHRLLRPRPA